MRKSCQTRLLDLPSVGIGVEAVVSHCDLGFPFIQGEKAFRPFGAEELLADKIGQDLAGKSSAV